MGLMWGNAFSQAGEGLAAVGMEGVRAALEQDKIKLADALAEGRAVREGDRAEQRQIRTEGRAPANAAALIAARNPGLLALAQGESDIRVKADETINRNRLNLELSPETTQKKIDQLNALAPVQRQIKIDDAIEQTLQMAGEPGYLDAVRKIAKAQQVLTPGQAAEGELKQIELSRERTKETMRKAYTEAVTSGDTTRANNIAQAIAAYAFDPSKESTAVTAAKAILADINAPEDQKARARDTLIAAATRPQGGTPGKAPYPEGTELKGPDGKTYVVKDGAPVLKGVAAVEKPRSLLNSTSTAAPSTELGADSETSRLPGAKHFETQERIRRLEAALKSPGLPETERRRFQDEIETLQSSLTQ